MDKIKKELKYSLGNDEISVWLADSWPVGNIYTDNYKLIDFVLDDINKNYLTINGALFYVPNDNNKIREVMQKNDYVLMNRAYKIENKIYDIDKNKYRCSSKITDREKEYYAKHMNELYNVNTGIEIINNKLQKGHIVHVFYEQEEIIGIITMLLADDDIPSFNLFANDKEIAIYMIQYILNEYKKDIYLIVINEHKILMDALDEIGAKIEWSNYRGESFLLILEELSSVELYDTSDDIKGIAFELFLGKTFRGELGQFFTPRTIVNYMVEVLNVKEGDKVCDPCCGSGGFLIKAFEHVQNQIDQDIHKQITILMDNQSLSDSEKQYKINTLLSECDKTKEGK